MIVVSLGLTVSGFAQRTAVAMAMRVRVLVGWPALEGRQGH